MSIERIMTRPVVQVAMDDSLARVKEMFERHQFHHLLVVEDERLVGVISDRDLLKALSPHLGTASENARDLATLTKRAHQIMTRHPIVLREKDSIRQAIQLFNTHRISCLPVVDAHARPVGIVSWRDILRALHAAAPKEATPA